MYAFIDLIELQDFLSFFLTCLNMPIIIYSEINIASANICKYIIEKYDFEKIKEDEWVKDIEEIKEKNKEIKVENKEIKGKEIKNEDKENIGDRIRIVKVKENVIDFSFKETVDYIIVASTHKSSSNNKSLCVHVPGNWSSADMGGQKETLNICYASKMKTIMLNIQKLAEERKMTKETADGWEITLEVDHHGPTAPLIHPENPIMFVEIGSTEKEWNDKNAISLIGDAIMLSISDNTTYTTVLGFGGGHYASKFNKYELNKEKYSELNYAISHILPKYRFDDFKQSADEMFKQALEKNVEKIDTVLIDWKGLKTDQRQLIIDLCEKNNIEWKKA